MEKQIANLKRKRSDQLQQDTHTHASVTGMLVCMQCAAIFPVSAHSEGHLEDS